MSDDIPMMLEREAGAPETIPMVGVGFCLHAEENEVKSLAANHPVFVDREFVKIAVPGDPKSIHFQPSTDRDRKRYPKAYAAFKQQTLVATEGMPIEQWAAVSRSQAMTFKAANIPTVEALAEVSDTNCQNLGFDGIALRERARAFLKQAKDSAAAEKFAVENKQLRDQISDQQRQINELAQKLQEFIQPQPAAQVAPPLTAVAPPKQRAKPKTVPRALAPAEYDS